VIEFQEEDYWDALPEMKELFEDTHEEVGPFKEAVFDVDYSVYNTLADAGQLLIFTARDEKDLVGYAVFMLVNHQYYTGMLVAQSDIIYMKPEYRGLVACEFIKEVDRLLEVDHGVAGITIQVVMERDFSSLLEHLDYTTTAKVCSRYIGDDQWVK
jgi:hypothetical protein